MVVQALSFFLGMRTIVYLLLHPMSLGVILALAGWLLHKWSPRIGRPAFWLAVLYGTFLLLSPFPKLLVAEWESRYLPLSTINCSPQAHIVVLASGFTADERLPASGQLNGSSLARLTEGLRLAYQCPAATFVVSGPDDKHGISQAEVTRQAAISLGMPAGRLRMLDNPTNTAGEAAATRALLGTDQPIILVTSAIHMHRSVYWFRQEGIDVTPAPTNYLVKQDVDYLWYTWSPLQNIQLLDAWIHEAVGLLWARWLTR